MNRVLFVLLILCVASLSTDAQLEWIDKPFVSSKVTVRLIDPNGHPIVGGRVELMSFDWKKTLKEGSTNLNGYYSFKVYKRKTYFLRVHARPFRQYEFKIDMQKSKRKMIQLVMELAI